MLAVRAAVCERIKGRKFLSVISKEGLKTSLRNLSMSYSISSEKQLFGCGQAAGMKTSLKLFKMHQDGHISMHRNDAAW